jgi:hypothetical protein
VLLALFASLALASAALAAYPQDPPDDPNYDPVEDGAPATCTSEGTDIEEHHQYDFMPACTPSATDAENASGMSLNKAWSDFTTGADPGVDDTVIAYIEGGINWQDSTAELADKVFINSGELPDPTDPDANTVRLSASDYAVFDGTATPDANGNGVVDPEDLIVRFSDGIDDDGNGYTDDISGWDFYNDQNDPATIDSTYDHANGQMKQAAAETNNGTDGTGVCPDCMLLPVKAGAEALDRTDDLAQAWLYAGDLGADVIVSTTADLGYSTFMDQAVEKLWNDGVVMVESSNDFNSTDHQGGMFHPHVLPGNGLVSNAEGLERLPGGMENALITTYRARSNYPEWGTHNMFVAATQGGTTSESSPTVGGVLGIVLAYGKKAADDNLIDSPLSGPEAIQVVRDTASDIATNPNPPNGWPAQPGFDLQYGYGRPNVWKAMDKISNGEIPPVAWIDSPAWYALYNPDQTSGVPVTGHVEANRSSVDNWELEFAAGGEPPEDTTDAAWITAATGDSAVDGALGTIDLSQVPESFWHKAMEMSQTKTLETNEHYTITIRLRVTDADGRVGEERRSIAVQRDDTWHPGFPKKIGPGGESQPVLADLQGTGQLAIIFGDSDGVVHAIGPNGEELPGWPVTTNATQVTRQHTGIDPGHEPIVPGIATGDLDHDGNQWVVATSSTGRTYVWDANGNRRSGWPKAIATGVAPPAVPRPPSPFTRLPIMGATASPVLADLNGDDRLDIIQAGWDGYIHAWNRFGGNLSGWPVKVQLPDGYTSSMQIVNDQKLDPPPALAELDGDASPELVVRSQYNETPGAGLQIAGANGADPPKSHLHAYNSNGTPVPNWDPLTFDALVLYYGSAQEFITEGANAPIAGDVDGDGVTEIEAAPGIFSPSYLFNGDGSESTVYGPVPSATTDTFASLLDGTISPATATNLLGGDIPDDAPVNFTGSGAFGKLGPLETMGFAEPGSGASSVASSLLLPGSGTPINSYMRIHEAQSGVPFHGFPSQSQGLDFLGAPAIADVSGDGVPEILEGGDSSVLHAFMTDASQQGAQADDFPKFTTGWILGVPAIGDIDSDGKVEVVTMTREGYLMVWDTPGTDTGNDEWWNGRHDERNTAQYGLDTRPPGIIRGMTVEGSTLKFAAPGDEWYAGTADHYEVATSNSPITPANFGQATQLDGEPAPAASGQQQTFELPGTIGRYVAMRAVDEAGNLGPIRVRDRGPGSSGGGSGKGACGHRIKGTRRRDVLIGTPKGDAIFARRGNDRVRAGGGIDCVRGSGGKDRIAGGERGDTLRGGKGRDELKGGNGRDVLRGGYGRDILKARDATTDVVDCGPGRHDKAIADASDRLKRCERVRRKRAR